MQPPGWINIDGSRRARLACRFPWLDRLFVWLHLLPPTEFGPGILAVDLRKPLPFADNSVSAIYSGEMLEHFTREDGRRLLAECYRILAPGGVLRVRVPDNYRFWWLYVRQYEQTFAAPREQWDNHHSRWVEMFFSDVCVHPTLFRSMGHFHKWMYDEVSLILAFEHSGFTKVERRYLHESRIPDVAVVETRDDLIVEGIKPWYPLDHTAFAS